MSKKLISLLLSLLLVLGTVGVPVGADAADTKSITITLDANSGKFSTTPYDKHFIPVPNVDKDTTYSLSSHSVSRTGYTFVGWFTSSSGGTQAEDGYTLLKTEDHTLYARWEKEKYTYTLDAGGGYFGNDTSKITTTATLEYGDAFSKLTKPQRPGYTFAGWIVNGTSIKDTDTASGTHKNATFTAQWTAQPFTVTLNPNGGTGLTTTSFSVISGTEYGTNLNQSPTRTGYDFDGWFTAASGGTKVEPTSTFTGSGNQTLYAQWIAKEVTVKLNYNYPEDYKNNTDVQADSTLQEPAQETKTVKFDSTYGTIVDAPTRPTLTFKEFTGNLVETTYTYNFAGWYPEKEDTEKTATDEAEIYDKVLSTDKVSKEGTIDLYARWTYEVELNPDREKGGVVSPTKIKVTTGTAVGSLPTPTCTGYDFGGWYTAIGYNDEVTADSIIDSKLKTLFAKFEPSPITVTLDPNGGEFADGVSSSNTVTYGDPYGGTLLGKTDVTKIGYELKGWCTSDDTEVTADTKVTETKNHTLYAQWEPCSYPVTLNYGELIDNLDPEYKKPKENLNIKIDDPLTGLPMGSTVPAFERDGTKFTFYQWYTKDGAMVNSLTRLTPDMLNEDKQGATLYARWNYNIGFYNNTATTSSATNPNTTVSFTTGTQYGDKFPTPTNTGKTLLGWFTAADNSGTQVNPSETANGTITKLYAHWTDSQYVVTLDPNGGKFDDTQKVHAWEYGYGDAYGSNITNTDYVPAVIPAGHTFDGWYTEKEGGTKLTSTTKVTETCTIYAHWKADQFKVTLNLNYSGAQNTVKTVDYDTVLDTVLPDPEPERTGYAFEGWFTDEKCTAAVDKKLAVKADITVYAKWIEAKRVELVVGGGTLPAGAPAYINVYEGGTYEKLPSPTWFGCTFSGWWTAETTGGKEIKNIDKIVSASSIPDTLYARWTPKKVTVSFNYNGANLERPAQQYDVGSTYNRLPLTARWDGHEFMGWYTKAVGGDKVDSSTTVSVTSDREEDLNVTLYAHWGYTVVFDSGDGMGDMEKQIAEMDQPYTLPTCTFTPPDGMRFGGWAIGTPEGPTQPGGSQYTVTRNLTLYATWTTAPITITATCTSGGSLMTDDGKSNAVSVERGEDVTFIATANTGYVLKELMVDGVNFNYTDVYTFRDVIEDHTIHAVFERIGAPAYSTCDHGNSCPLAGYSDLNPNQWYHDGVHFCIDNVLMGGTSSSRFVPGNNSTRGELAVSMWNYAGRPDSGGSGPLNKTYTDVKTSDWYYQAVEWATKQNILAGYGNGRFGPNDSITREQLVSILWRHAGQPKARQTTLRFYDASQVSSYAWDAMLWATEEGILQGRSTGYLVPKGTATRAEVATMLKNYLG